MTSLSKLPFYSLNTYKVCILLHNKSKFYYKTLPPPNPQVKFQEDVCAMCIQWHHLTPSSPTQDFPIMHMHIKCTRRWEHYCHFTEGSQGLEAFISPHSLPPAAQPPPCVPITPAVSKIHATTPAPFGGSNGTLCEKELCRGHLVASQISI